MIHTLKPEVRGELDIRKNFCKTDTETKCLSLRNFIHSLP